jgi:hypothetical protein
MRPLVYCLVFALLGPCAVAGISRMPPAWMANLDRPTIRTLLYVLGILLVAN